MDEADDQLITEFVKLIQAERQEKWIDIHNLRIIKYGSTLHMDCHLTLPYYLNVKEAHDEVEKLDEIVNAHFGTRVELFVHTDPCMPYSCKICTVENCPVRQHPFEKILIWDKQNISRNQKHTL
jgi:divalent metal cation (Fe/Co/Zn/Cd) transporter